MTSAALYIRESLEELRHVRWPTRQQAVRFSAVVIVFSAVSGIVFGVIDFAFSQVVHALLSLV